MAKTLFAIFMLYVVGAIVLAEVGTIDPDRESGGDNADTRPTPTPLQSAHVAAAQVDPGA
jgi:hypothetical protein